jgi:hypothetical protein
MKTDNSISPELKMKLKNGDPEIHIFVKALVSENLNLQKQVFKAEAKNVSFNNRISVLENELKEIQPFREMPKERRNELMKELEENLEIPKFDLSKLSPDEVIQLSNILKKLGRSLLDSK